MKITIGYEDGGEASVNGVLRWMAETRIEDKYICAYGPTKEDARNALIKRVYAWQRVKTESEEVEI